MAQQVRYFPAHPGDTNQDVIDRIFEGKAAYANGENLPTVGGGTPFFSTGESLAAAAGAYPSVRMVKVTFDDIEDLPGVLSTGGQS